MKRMLIGLASLAMLAGPALADEFNFGDGRQVRDVMSGFGSAKEQDCQSNGDCWFEGRADGQKYFLRVYGVNGDVCRANCTAILNVCNIDWQMTEGQRAKWIDAHWSVATHSQADGGCLNLYFNPYSGHYTTAQVEAGFELFLNDLKDYVREAR